MGHPMTCPFCVDWNQTDPNCAHGLLDGINPGSLWFHRLYVLGIEVGGRAIGAVLQENTHRERAREHVVRIATYATRRRAA